MFFKKSENETFLFFCHGDLFRAWISTDVTTEIKFQKILKKYVMLLNILVIIIFISVGIEQEIVVKLAVVIFALLLLMISVLVTKFCKIHGCRIETLEEKNKR